MRVTIFADDVGSAVNDRFALVAHHRFSLMDRYPLNRFGRMESD